MDLAVAAAKKVREIQEQERNSMLNSAQAFKTAWGLKVPGRERGILLAKLADLVEKHADELAALEAINVGEYRFLWSVISIDDYRQIGKPFNSARVGDVKSTVSTIRYYAGYADKIHGKTIEVGSTLCDDCPVFIKCRSRRQKIRWRIHDMNLLACV